MNSKKYAADLIDKLYHEYDSESETVCNTISLRLEPKHGLMLKGLAQLFGFSATGVFTDIISKHLFDMLVSLEPEEYEQVYEKARSLILSENGNVSESYTGALQLLDTLNGIYHEPIKLACKL